MRIRLICWLSVVMVILALAVSGCGGGGRTVPTGTSRIPLPPIDFTITLPQNAGITPASVGFERLRLQEALNMQKTPNDLPRDYRMVEAFAITPEDARFSDSARVRLVPEESLPAGTRLFLFKVGASRNCIPVDDAHVKQDGSVTFETKAFGFFVVAENTLIARPSEQFICFAFATVVEGPLPLSIHANTVSLGGREPITYTWDMGDGSEALFGTEVEHTFYEVGDYNISVFGTDANGATTNVFSTVISVTSMFQPLESVDVPFIIPTNPALPNERRFIPEVVGGVPPLVWEWAFSDGHTSTEAVPIHEFPAPGMYSGSVTVMDAALDTASASFVADVRRLSLNAEPAFGYSPMEVTFTIVAEGIGEDASAAIDFGDGSVEPIDLLATHTISHTYASAGTFTALATATEFFEGAQYTARSLPVAVSTIAPPQPTVYSIFPANAAEGDEVTIFGAEFGHFQQPGDEVLFQPSLAAQVVEWADGAITAVIPSGAVDGNVVVVRAERDKLYQSNEYYYDIREPGVEPQPPGISFISPNRGPIGTTVTVIGANFGGQQEADDTIKLGNREMPVISWANDVIEATVPPFASSGDITVTNSGLVSNALYFEVGVFLPSDPPVITSITPTEGTRNTMVILTGINFGSRLPNSIVFIGPRKMSITSWADTQVVVTIPNKALNGEIRIYTWGMLSNGIPFIVLPNPPNVYGLEQL